MVTAIISALGVLFASIVAVILKYYFDYKQLKNKALSKTTSRIINEQILEPFHFSIELSLYKLIIAENKELTKDNQIPVDRILHSLTQLQNRINANPLIYSYMTDFFLNNLSNTIDSIESKKRSMRKINKNYQAFSGMYFDLLNQVRKSNFLPRRGDRYRMTFNLYKQKNARRFENIRTFQKVFAFATIYLAFSTLGILFIVSCMHLLVSSYDLIQQLYQITN
ncbi:hypothetical protein [Lactococcus lactis]|uniref:hypothetical protein n=1 Tax=Lactococcus lactis TaxID=1358 RepID=UPI0035BC3C8B